MDILFIHQNMPGQYKHLAPALARSPAHRVVFLTRREGVDLPGVRVKNYTAPKPASRSTHQYLRQLEASTRYGQQAARGMLELKAEGFDPAVVVGHPGWGEMLFVKEVFPRAAVVSFAEFYYSGQGADIGFDPAETVDVDALCRARMRNAHLLLSLELADVAVAPTEWQRSRHPAALQSKIHTIFDGIDTKLVAPRDGARFAIKDGPTLTAADEVVTYVSRNLEPYRGYPSFIRALPAILAARPNAHVVIVGGDEVSYGRSPPDGQSWRQVMEAEVPLTSGPYASRVHVLGRLPYARYLDLLRVSSAHIYLTVPFVLSWSCVEAMAAGCLMVASATPPVEEVITDGYNGLLVPFFDHAAIAARTIEALAGRAALAPLRAAARQTVLDRYDLGQCLPRQVDLVLRAAGARIGRKGAPA